MVKGQWETNLNCPALATINCNFILILFVVLISTKPDNKLTLLHYNDYNLTNLTLAFGIRMTFG